MHSRWIIQLLLGATSLLTVAQAAAHNDQNQVQNQIDRRQKGVLTLNPLGGDASKTSTDDSDTASATPTPTKTSDSSESGDSSKPTSSPDTSQSPSAKPDTTTTDKNDPSPTKTSSVETSTSVDDSKTTKTPDTTTSSEEVKQTTSTESKSKVIQVSTSTKVITTTNADGAPTTMTTQALQTNTALVDTSDSGNQKSSGMSTTTRNTIIGVVVGVGGAIVLAVIGVVAWRIWGRKKPAEESDGLMDYGGNSFNGNEVKSDAGASSNPGRSPFQSTLESYHAPTQVNTAANF